MVQFKDIMHGLHHIVKIISFRYDLHHLVLPEKQTSSDWTSNEKESLYCSDHGNRK